MTYWEDRLTVEQGKEINKTLACYVIGKISDQVAYDELTNAGMTSEEADEMINCIEVDDSAQT